MYILRGVYPTLKVSHFFARRELKGRFSGSLLGPLVLFAQPVLMCIILLFVFSYVFRVKLPGGAAAPDFGLFLISGFVPWMQFQESATRASSCIIENRELVLKTTFSLESIVIGVSSAVHLIYLPLLAVFALYCVYAKAGPPLCSVALSMMELVLLSFLQLLYTVGVGYILSSLSVYVRDLLQVVPVLFQLWFYATPIVYPMSMVPQKFRVVLSLNPWRLYAEGYRSLLLYFKPLNIEMVSALLITSVLTFLVGRFVFVRLKDGFADAL